jgi:hypothetical protein
MSRRESRFECNTLPRVVEIEDSDVSSFLGELVIQDPSEQKPNAKAKALKPCRDEASCKHLVKQIELMCNIFRNVEEGKLRWTDVVYPQLFCKFHHDVSTIPCKYVLDPNHPFETCHKKHDFYNAAPRAMRQERPVDQQAPRAMRQERPVDQQAPQPMRQERPGARAPRNLEVYPKPYGAASDIPTMRAPSGFVWSYLGEAAGWGLMPTQ